MAELEATRGLAALIVAGAHIGQTPVDLDGVQSRLLVAGRASDSSVEWALSNLLHALLDGNAAVLYFFVLSGFVLAASLERDSPFCLAAVRRFVARRLFRIYPAVFFAILTFVGLYWLTGRAIHPSAYGLLSILRNALLLEVSIDGVMWTMQAELIAVPLILIGFLLWYRGWHFLLWLLLIVLIALSFWPSWGRLTAWPGGLSRTTSIYAFLFGVIAYVHGAAIVKSAYGQRPGLWIAASVLVFFGAGPALGYGSKFTMLAQVAASAVMIAFLAFGRNLGVSTFLNLRSVRALGRVSYSFYLLHPLTLTVVWFMPATWGQIIESSASPLALVLCLWIATSLAVFLLALFAYRFVEAPGNALGRYFTRSRAEMMRLDATGDPIKSA